MQSKVLTILFTDMKGFTESSGSRSRQEVLQLVQRHDTLLRPILGRFGGTVVKTIGDAFLATFESPTNAVLCGLMMQATLREHNQAAPEGERIEIRVAINTGEVQLTEEDLFGEPVNIASRINAITEPGEVYFTHAVYLAMNRTEVPSSEVGERILKGVPEPIKVYRLMQDAASDQYRKVLSALKGRTLGPTPEELRGDLGRPPARRGLARAAAAVAVLAALGAAGWWWSRPDAIARAREFARAGGFSQAWAELDRRFQDAPSDPRVAPAGRELLETQLAKEAAQGDFGRTIAFLEEQRKAHGWVPDVDGLIVHTKQERARELMRDSEKGTAYGEGLDLLWSLVEARPKDARLRLDFLLAYAGFPQRWESKVVEHLDAALQLDPALAADPRTRDLALKMARSQAVPASHEEDARRFWEIVARHWGAELKEELRPKVVAEAAVEVRLHAYGIVSRVIELTPGEVFEYHRLNLFECVDFLTHYHEEAVKYFAEHFRDRPDAAKAYTQGQTYTTIPVLEKYLSGGLEETIPILSALFYEGSRDFLREGVLRKDEVVLRYNCARVLAAHQELSPETVHEYHLLNLREYGLDQLRYGYTWIEEALRYLQSGIADPAARAEGAALVLEKLEMLRKAKGDERIPQSAEVVDGLIAELEKARIKLGEQE